MSMKSSGQDRERGGCGDGNGAPASLERVRNNNYLSFGGAGTHSLHFPWAAGKGRRRLQLFYNFDLFVSQTSNMIRQERERRRLQSQEEQQRSSGEPSALEFFFSGQGDVMV